jgi:cobalt/nickel transport system permease protein
MKESIMHIPDGYLSPVMSLGVGALTVPSWIIASRRVQKVLNHRTVPLLGIFSAFSFTIMMFNIPVPGGTTAHAVGGTLMAIVLGPSAAIIGISIALIIQALFFGDGGILAIFINCLNMGVLLPLVGYNVYRLIAGNAAVLSRRRVWAAGIGAYVGLVASALAVGIELGVQPILFTENGRPLYSPYALEQAIPAMLISHLFAAAIVEAAVTSFAVGYLQRTYPQYLTSLKQVFASEEAETEALSQPSRLPGWVIPVGGVSAILVFLFVVGLITGQGKISNLFGADWTQVNWSDIAGMLLFAGIFAAVLLPITYWILPRSIKQVGTIFATLILLAPIGLISPGFAYGEGSAEDVQSSFGYIPKGLQDMSNFFSAPFSDYSLPGGFFSGEEASLWRVALGYEISGVIGVLLLLGISTAIGYVLRTRKPSLPSSPEVSAT